MARRRKAGARPVGDVLARRLREARGARNWTQQELAAELERLGAPMDRTTIAKIEKGQRQARVEELIALAAALDVAPVHLFLPIEDDGLVALTPKLEVDVEKAWRWARGRQPLDPANIRTYSFQHPGDIGVINPEASPEEKAAALAEFEERLLDMGVRVVHEPAKKGATNG